MSANTLKVNVSLKATVRNWAIEVVKFSHTPVQDLESEKAWPTLGNSTGKANQPNTRRPSAWGKLPDWVVAAQANSLLAWAQAATTPDGSDDQSESCSKDRISQELEGEPNGDSQVES